MFWSFYQTVKKRTDIFALDKRLKKLELKVFGLSALVGSYNCDGINKSLMCMLVKGRSRLLCVAGLFFVGVQTFLQSTDEDRVARTIKSKLRIKFTVVLVLVL